MEQYLPVFNRFHVNRVVLYHSGSDSKMILFDLMNLFDPVYYCLTKISIPAKHSISRIFSLFIIPSSFFVYCSYKG